VKHSDEIFTKKPEVGKKGRFCFQGAFFLSQPLISGKKFRIFKNNKIPVTFENGDQFPLSCRIVNLAGLRE
jgi:hypothetical protein